MEKSKEKEYLTVDQLCLKLGIGRNKAYTLLRSNRIESFRIDHQWRIPSGSVDKYVSDMLTNENK